MEFFDGCWKAWRRGTRVYCRVGSEENASALLRHHQNCGHALRQGETSSPSLPMRGCTLPSANAVRPVTPVCDASHDSAPKFFRRLRYGLPECQPSRCRVHASGLCANLRFCDESTDSQAVLPICTHIRGNQLRNIALGRPKWLRNIPTSRSVSRDSAPRPSHPQSFPQGKGVSGSGFWALSGHWFRFTRRVRCCLRAGWRSVSNYAGTPD